ncbi:hypothetical protein [Sphingomonas pokkalii]|uniref:General secretion pathway protein GspM n=1 Tax=Sphingomonas pokkalii TaxID=2175090 RepID=A0A2U0SGN6_9SPHN|nr:hypothetical protein [Sphingomonas pokkalii]PVX30454.1 hypothetical protein DD559_14790 [Sphingomonas pokkalii]
MRRRPLLYGVLLGLVLALSLAPWTGAAIGALAKARAERARLAGLAAAPAAPIAVLAPSLAFPAQGGDAAMRVRIERLARGGGVLVEALAPAAAPAPLIAVTIRLSGPEKAVIAVADAIERERPLLRFRSWRIEPAEGSGVRLRGDLIGAVR